MQDVTYDQASQTMKQNASPLINVLPTEKFAQNNIQGTQNIPGNSASFAQDIESKIGGKDKPVTLYCASSECPASHEAATKLEQTGFTNVSVYKGGAKEWNEKSSTSQAA